MHVFHTKLRWIWLSSGKPPNGLFLKLLGCTSNHHVLYAKFFVVLCLPKFVLYGTLTTLSWCALWIAKEMLYLTGYLVSTPMSQTFGIHYGCSHPHGTLVIVKNFQF